MSNSNTTRIIVKEHQLFLDVWLEDTNFREIAHSSNGNLSVDVFPGIYVLKSRMGREVAKKLVEVDGSQPELYLDAPANNWKSSMPLNSEKTEFFDKRVNFITDLVKLPPIKIGEGSSLFIFATGKGTNADSLGNVRLESVDGDVLFQFKDLAENQVMVELRKFYAGITLELSPGPYCLISEWEGMQTAMMVYLYPNWQTRLFAENCENGMQLSELSITMDRPRMGYDPNRRDLRTTALALEAMRNVEAKMPESDQEEVMLILKFENPMLGLYWLHLAQKMSSLNHELVAMVLENMQSMIPFHPDLVAAWLGFRQRFAPDFLPSLSAAFQDQFHSFSHPPMLMGSYRILVEASMANPAWIEPDSLMENIIPNVLGTGPWLLWKGFEEKEEESEGEPPMRSGPYEKEKMRSLIMRKLDSDSHMEVYIHEDDKGLPPTFKAADEALKDYFTRNTFPSTSSEERKTQKGTEELVRQLVSMMISPSVYNGAGNWRERISPVGRQAMWALSSGFLGGLWEVVMDFQKQKYEPARNVAYQLTEIPKHSQFEMVGLSFLGHPERLKGWIQGIGFEPAIADELIQKLIGGLESSGSLLGLSQYLKLPVHLVADGMLDAIQEIGNAQANGEI